MKDKAINDAMNSTENRIRHVYNQGYEDGKASVQIDDSTAYKAGLEAAWECARKIGKTNWITLEKMGFENKDKEKNPSWDVIMEYSADEAMAKIKEYEEKLKPAEDAEIKVGDEVIYHGRGAQIGVHDGSVGVVLGIEKEWVGVRFKSSWNCVGICKDKLTKTGRHFSQIEEVLEQMKGEAE